MKSQSFDETAADIFRENPQLAADLLTEILEDGDQGELLVILRQIALSQKGGVKAVAEKANVNATQLYRTLSNEGNPKLSTLTAILDVLGFRLSVQPVQQA